MMVIVRKNRKPGNPKTIASQSPSYPLPNLTKRSFAERHLQEAYGLESARTPKSQRALRSLKTGSTAQSVLYYGFGMLVSGHDFSRADRGEKMMAVSGSSHAASLGLVWLLLLTFSYVGPTKVGP